MKQGVRLGSREVEIGHDDEGQFIRIPEDMEFAVTKVTIWKDCDRLIIEPISRKNLTEVLSGLEPLSPEDQFPNID